VIYAYTSLLTIHVSNGNTLADATTLQFLQVAQQEIGIILRAGAGHGSWPACTQRPRSLCADQSHSIVARLLPKSCNIRYYAPGSTLTLILRMRCGYKHEK